MVVGFRVSTTTEGERDKGAGRLGGNERKGEQGIYYSRF